VINNNNNNNNTTDNGVLDKYNTIRDSGVGLLGKNYDNNTRVYGVLITRRIDRPGGGPPRRRSYEIPFVFVCYLYLLFVLFIMFIYALLR